MNVLGIDIGGTKIAAAIMQDDGRMSHGDMTPTPAQAGPMAILQAVGELGTSVRAAGRIDGIEVVAVGVGTAGLIDHPRGVVVYATETLTKWAGVPVAETLHMLFQLPVVVDNDVNTLALGEQHYGAGRPFEHVLYVAVGTGIGGAVVLNGQLWRGATFSAGEIGHLVVDYHAARRCSCGQWGHLEAYTAGPALVARYRELSSMLEPLDLRMVAIHARGGDPMAIQAIREGGRSLGLALGGLLCALDPQAVIIGGGVANLGPEWWEPLETAIRATALPGPAHIVIKPAQLGVSAVLSGAAWLAHQAQGDSL